MQAWQWAPGATPFLVSLKFMFSICDFGGPGPVGMNTASREYQRKWEPCFSATRDYNLFMFCCCCRCCCCCCCGCDASNENIFSVRNSAGIVAKLISDLMTSEEFFSGLIYFRFGSEIHFCLKVYFQLNRIFAKVEQG